MNRLVEFGLLGSVEARVDGRPLDLGHARQRCVLAALLVDVDRVVPADRLVERVWADPASPRRARDTLYGYVSRLRRALADVEGVDISRSSGGYVLGVGRAVVDLREFRDLVGRARTAERDDRAADLFDRALGLWRGDALAGLDTLWSNELRDTLDHERFGAELDRTDARLRCGRHAELSGELARRARTHPLDERLAGQLMLALYRCGRPADALHHYRQLRERLCEELGCDPGPRLRELHQWILTTDPALDLPVGAGPAAVAEPAVLLRAAPARRLVGRTAELALAEGAIEDTLTGGPAVLELVGEPGIGKTRLLEEVGERARRRGLTVLTGRCPEFDQAPYGVLVDALDEHLGAPLELPDLSLDLLGTVFPALAERRPGAKPVEAERYWFHRSLQALLNALGGSGGLVLRLDDLHWSDPATVEFIDHVVRHPPRTPLLLVLAHRARQSPPRLVAALARAQRAGHCTRVEVGPLTPAESAELCGAAARSWEFGRLYAASEGNPFYLEALARSARSRPPSAPGAPGCVDELPHSVRAALEEELEALSPAARATAGAGAVLGDAFDAELAAAVARIDLPRTLSALDQLVERDLVRQVDFTRRFRFRHPLVRAAVYQGLGAGWRIQAHARAADGLAARGASPADRASHVQRSARLGDTDAAGLLVRAARQIMAAAPVTSASWTGEALRLLGATGADRPELLLQQAEALSLAGRLRDSRVVLREVATLLPTDAWDARARLTASLARTQWLLGRYGEALSLLREELARRAGRADSPAPALHLAAAAAALRSFDLPAAVDWAERARDASDRSGNLPCLAEAHGLLALAHIQAGDDARSAHHLDRALGALACMADEPSADWLNALVTVGWTQMFQGRYDAALQRIDRGLDICQRTGRSTLLADLLEARAYVHLWLGRLDEAAAGADDALEAAALVGSDEPCSLAESVRAAVLLWRGDAPGAQKLCRDSLSRTSTDPESRRATVTALLGQALLLTGDPEGCVRTVLDGGGGPELVGYEAPLRPLWFGVLTSAELARGDIAAAGRWVRCAAAAVTPGGPPASAGFALLARAEVELLRREAAAASTALRAAEVFAAARMPLYEARARLIAGSALAASRSGPQALAELGRARTLAATAGAVALAEMADDEHGRVRGWM
ncbi:BTAD domain-containing putative transcriptional regulator [Streptomyces sp. TLI_146]|uniref:BTAD domain-containing putative transcriptional regulator n=1 Tax=Streptomyces sp. TLI_146 TaxID=1938858 RepID=UPI00214C6C39|nr:BTAD domain-containing putative transcriptional regulator [Streptomyces sp. TLI_146]